MDERELIEIESRLSQYPPQAQQDILALTRELRRVASPATTARTAVPATSPLYDAPTGLLNGGAYGVRFAMARARATRFKKIFAVLSVDVVLPAGADVLTPADRELTVRHVAQRLEASVRATDTLARVGAENFAVILEDLNQAGDAERVKQIVQDALAPPLSVGGREIVPELRIGIDFYPSLAGASAGPVH